MPSPFKRDSKGLAAILKDGARFYPALRAIAEPIAASVQEQHPDVEEVAVDEYMTDRAAVSVTVKDVRAKGWQATDGLLTRAAAAKGLEVKERSE